MSDYLLLAGVALCAISVIAAVVQLLQTQPPRAAAIMLILGIVAIFAAAYTSDEPLQPESVFAAWDRLTGGEGAAAPVAEEPVAEPEGAVTN
ncbi:hypothetical protein JJJ17_07300 [Paracoccus caeni]|uniref:Uncharacterized protein n=1 Tax=Paracoccus caeni TaxID=657651 RepID=A0A934SEX2_9RHOB|nr:hypothetical protein [Paracoccus caeni]MBK4215726.1 hypothetical protein [Paracoccus caeni]